MTKSKIVRVFVGLMCALVLVPILFAQDADTKHATPPADPDLNAQLRVAATTGTAIEIQNLINAGAMATTSTLWTAAENNTFPGVITVLLKASADAKAMSDSGKTALDYAKENENLKNTDVYWKLVDASF